MLHISQLLDAPLISGSLVADCSAKGLVVTIHEGLKQAQPNVLLLPGALAAQLLLQHRPEVLHVDVLSRRHEFSDLVRRWLQFHSLSSANLL